MQKEREGGAFIGALFNPKAPFFHPSKVLAGMVNIRMKGSRQICNNSGSNDTGNSIIQATPESPRPTCKPLRATKHVSKIYVIAVRRTHTGRTTLLPLGGAGRAPPPQKKQCILNSTAIKSLHLL